MYAIYPFLEVFSKNRPPEPEPELSYLPWPYTRNTSHFLKSLYIFAAGTRTPFPFTDAVAFNIDPKLRGLFRVLAACILFSCAVFTPNTTNTTASCYFNIFNGPLIRRSR